MTELRIQRVAPPGQKRQRREREKYVDEGGTARGTAWQSARGCFSLSLRMFYLRCEAFLRARPRLVAKGASYEASCQRPRRQVFPF